MTICTRDNLYGMFVVVVGEDLESAPISKRSKERILETLGVVFDEVKQARHPEGCLA